MRAHFAAFSLALLLTPCTLPAEVVFTTIPAGVTGPADSNIAFQLAGSRHDRLGYRFVPAVAGRITQIDCWAFAVGGDGYAAFELYDEVMGQPGERLKSMPIALPPNPNGGSPNVPTPTHTITNGPFLSAGVPYFLVLTPDRDYPFFSNSLVHWFQSSPTSAPEQVQCYRTGDTQTWLIGNGPLQVNGLTVHIPVPAAGSALALAGLGCAFRRRRSRDTYQTIGSRRGRELP